MSSMNELMLNTSLFSIYKQAISGGGGGGGGGGSFFWKYKKSTLI